MRNCVRCVGSCETHFAGMTVSLPISLVSLIKSSRVDEWQHWLYAQVVSSEQEGAGL